LPFVLLPGKAVRGGGRATSTHAESKVSGLSIEALKKQPLAIQRVLIRAAADSLGIVVDLAHVEEVLAIANGSGKACELPDGWRVQRSFRELRFEKSPKTATSEQSEYERSLPIPGEALVPGRNLVVHTQLLPVGQEDGAYNHGGVPDRLFAKRADNVRRANSAAATGQLQLLCGDSPKQLELLGFFPGELTLRNWRAGDRFRPAHCGSEKKVKELLQDLKVPQAERSGWPVIAAGKKLIWVRGTRPLQLWVSEHGNLQRLLIESKELPAAG
jgi:tRNA(Ile)-lysidine synthase